MRNLRVAGTAVVAFVTAVLGRSPASAHQPAGPPGAGHQASGQLPSGQQPSGPQITVPAGNAQQGKGLYLKYSCYACHGYDGHGGAGARLVPLAMTASRFTAYVRNPRRMPPYSEKVLTDAELADLFAYVKSLPVSPPADQIPLLSRIMAGK